MKDLVEKADLLAPLSTIVIRKRVGNGAGSFAKVGGLICIVDRGSHYLPSDDRILCSRSNGVHRMGMIGHQPVSHGRLGKKWENNCFPLQFIYVCPYF